jgi:hypothetical protein
MGRSVLDWPGVAQLFERRTQHWIGVGIRKQSARPDQILGDIRKDERSAFPS